MKKTILFFLCFILHCFSEEKYIIGTLKNEGFFSSFLSVVSKLVWADQEGKVPIVCWNEQFMLYEKKGHNGKTSAWEYYFLPVSDAVYTPLDGPQVCFEGAAPDGFHLFLQFLKDREIFHSNGKFLANAAIQKYVRVIPSIQKKVDTFYESRMQGKINIGIHFRGTDSSSYLDKKAMLEEMVEAAHTAAEGRAVQYFIATDDQSLLDEAKARLSSPVIYCESHQRSKDGRPLHVVKKNANGAGQLGEEILIEGLLLSRCDHMVHSHSSVPIAVMAFNPNLPTTFLDPFPWIHRIKRTN